MNHHPFKSIFIAIVALSALAAHAQSPGEHNTRTSQASLTVTAVVQSSVGLTSTADGTQQVFVANAPHSQTTLSRLDRWQSYGRGAIAYSFPAASPPYQLTRETVYASATSQPVIVVIVVPR